MYFTLPRVPERCLAEEDDARHFDVRAFPILKTMNAEIAMRTVLNSGPN
jgi:hypothetical protein